MKKILLLGGSAQQIIAIKTAKVLGYYTILCDYLPDNPGQYYADKFYQISTTEKDAVLKVAAVEKINGILAYASDPAAPTAAYVAEKMGLPGNPYESVEILCNKDKFRSFLAEHAFYTPQARGYNQVTKALDDLYRHSFYYPVIVKPVDSSGSKGVARIDSDDQAKTKIEKAMTFSHRRCIIIEEYVEGYGYQVAGDGLSIDGRLVFRCFANDHFNPNNVNPFVPIAASFPCYMPEKIQAKIHQEIQRLLSLLRMETCTYNFDIRIDKNFNVFLMEVAPRDGGNYIPQIIRYKTNIDLVECAVKAAMGEKIGRIDIQKKNGFYSYFAVHSKQTGKLKEIKIREDILPMIIENHVLAQPGDIVHAFTGANATLGCLIMKFESMEQMLDMMDHSEQWIQVILEKQLI